VPLSQTGTFSPSLHGRKRLRRSFLGRAMGEPPSLTQQSSSDVHGTGSTQTWWQRRGSRLSQRQRGPGWPGGRMSGSSPGAHVPAATSMRQPGGDVHVASTETGERLAAGRYAHWRSKQTQVPSGGMLLSHVVGGGAEAATTQRFGRHGSSHAQSVSFAHEAARDAPSLDAAAGVEPGSGAPGSRLAVGLPGVAAASAGVVAVAVAAGGRGSGVELDPLRP